MACVCANRLGNDKPAVIVDLEQIPNVGPAIAAKMRLIAISSPQDLVGKDPYTMYDDLCEITGINHDPCLLDVFISAVWFMEGKPAKPWWKYTPKRKQALAAKETA